MFRKLTFAMILMGVAGMANAVSFQCYSENPKITKDYFLPPNQTDFSGLIQTFCITYYNSADRNGAALNSVHINSFCGDLDSKRRALFLCVVGGVTSGNCSGSSRGAEYYRWCWSGGATNINPGQYTATTIPFSECSTRFFYGYPSQDHLRLQAFAFCVQSDGSWMSRPIH